MEPDSLSWLALTPGLASRLSARLLKRFGSPDAVFRAPLTDLEACPLPSRSPSSRKNPSNVPKKS
jgi:hypothetical protein